MKNTPLKHNALFIMISKRLNHPGIIFPDSPLHPINNPQLGTKKMAARKFRRRPVDSVVPLNWGVTTSQVAQKMEISESAARQLLHRHNIRNKVVRHPITNTLQLFWNRLDVDMLNKNIPSRITQLPPGYITTQEAAQLLSLSKTGLTRLNKRVKIPTKLIKFRQRNGERVHRIYRRDALIELLKSTRSAGFTLSPAALESCRQS